MLHLFMKERNHSNDCDYKCSRKSGMNTHVAYVHERKKPFKCGICEYKCCLNQQMKQHITKKHERNKL